MNEYKERSWKIASVAREKVGWGFAPHVTYLHDHLKSPVALVDIDGEVIERYEYDAYVKPTYWEGDYSGTIEATGIGNPYYFTGRRIDFVGVSVFMIQYNRNRFYDYKTGRWLNQDPFGLNVNGSCQNGFMTTLQYIHGMNLYHYNDNNPINQTDPMGLGWLTKVVTWYDCALCISALAGKVGGTIGGCIWGCSETDIPSLSTGDCILQCIFQEHNACELRRQFLNNPAEWFGLAACVSCGIHITDAILDACADPADGGGCDGDNCPHQGEGDYFPGGDIEDPLGKPRDCETVCAKPEPRNGTWYWTIYAHEVDDHLCKCFMATVDLDFDNFEFEDIFYHTDLRDCPIHS